MDYKAPWTYDNFLRDVRDGEDIWIADCVEKAGPLIAAAPELLAALLPFARLGNLFTGPPDAIATVNVSARDLQTAVAVYRKATDEGHP